jgi:hypothetical protein
MVMSAVSSVSTFGVLVTVMPLRAAASTSMWSVPLEKLAISFSCGPACSISAASIRSVTVGTSTSARFIAATSSGCVAASSMLSSASNSSRMRVSTASGSLRVM